MNARALFDLCKQSFASWRADYAPSMGAALAYYTVFSVAPLLLIVISVVGLVFGRDEARGEIFEQLSGLMGAEGARAIQIMLEALNKPRQGIVATVIGIALLLVGATTVFGELQDAFDRIWRAPAREEVNGLLDLMRVRLLSFSMIMGIGFLLIVSLVVNAALAALGEWWAPVFGGWAVLAQNVNSVFGFVIVTVGFAMIFKVMPRVSVQWRDVWIGAIVTAVLFTIGKYLIGLYIGKTGIASGYGAAGSLVVLLVWVYYSAQIFLLGVEFTWVYAHAYGSFKGRPRPAARASPTRAEPSA
ncbi:YihY/virulence factor BrkB family protein [Variovorax sp. J22R24]|uniref:YihY/virulence factor BrkB family protein n=1 Tax=Variovorax gracilis TaxID=3053502 RepID=UPI002576C848|nr:YihY/virulence factor BrkB family protein [Variovorax sp. J22R24]MDM0105638.1 YihY/virulence factor BrkB family protein [Variovorax sp. J22R24]